MQTEYPVKTEPDRLIASVLPLVEDEYEDTGELELPRELPTGWLVRVPKYVYEDWSSIEEDEEIQLGVLRHYTPSGKSEVRLDPTVKHNQKLPKQYTITIANKALKNTFIFSEKDLPNYKGRRRNGKPANVGENQHQFPGVGNPGINKFKRHQSWNRRTIPKQTMLSAAATHETTCSAVENEETRKILELRKAEQAGQKPTIKFVKDDPRKLAAPPMRDPFDNFIRLPGQPSAKERKNKDKAARMPQNELRDRILDCFAEYGLWSMRAFRQKLQQPESYLREQLGLMADYIKSGQNAGYFKLKPENMTRHIDLPPKEETAPEGGEELDDDEDDDDDDAMDDDPSAFEDVQF